MPVTKSLYRFGLAVGCFELVLYSASLGYCVYLLAQLSQYKSEEETPENLKLPNQFNWLIWVYLLLSICWLLTACGLIFGIFKTREEFMLPWFPFQTVAIIINSVLGVGRLFIDQQYIEIGLILAIVYSVNYAFLIFIMLLLYGEIEDHNISHGQRRK